jgi:hypothetical protein
MLFPETACGRLMGLIGLDFPDIDQVLRAEFVPEPATLLAFAAGLGFLVKRKKK